MKACNSVYRFTFPVPARRRLAAEHQCVARRAQPSQDADQGRHPVRGVRGRGRGQGARRAHDLQVRHRRRAVRRREGRRAGGSEEVPARGARAHHATLHARAREEEFHRARHRRAGAGLRQRRTRDGVDRRHLHGAQPRAARRTRVRHGQAGHAGRRARPQGSHGPRPVLRDSRGLQHRRRHEGARPRPGTRRQTPDHPGPRQRRAITRPSSATKAARSSSRSPNTRARSPIRTASIPRP